MGILKLTGRLFGVVELRGDGRACSMARDFPPAVFQGNPCFFAQNGDERPIHVGLWDTLSAVGEQKLHRFARFFLGPHCLLVEFFL